METIVNFLTALAVVICILWTVGAWYAYKYQTPRLWSKALRIEFLIQSAKAAPLFAFIAAIVWLIVVAA